MSVILKPVFGHSYSQRRRSVITSDFRYKYKMYRTNRVRFRRQCLNSIKTYLTSMTFVLSTNELSTIQFSKQLLATFIGGIIRQYMSIIILYSHPPYLFKYRIEYENKSKLTRYTSIIKLNNENVNFYSFSHQSKTVITTHLY